MIILRGKNSLTPNPSPKREGDSVESVEFRVILVYRFFELKIEGCD
jgi:hypothetical protein